jgi:hypothetical protein
MYGGSLWSRGSEIGIYCAVLTCNFIIIIEVWEW